MASTSAEQLIDDISRTAAKATDAVADAASEAKERASQFRRAASQKADDTRRVAADTMQDAAKSVRHRGQASSDAISGVANEAADRVEAGARYVRTNDFRGMVGDMVRRNPGVTLIAAIAAGFALGSALGGRKS